MQVVTMKLLRLFNLDDMLGMCAARNKMTELKKYALLPFLCLLFGMTSPAQSLEQWRCTTENFNGFDDADDVFIAKNLRKQFLLTVTENEVLVKTITKDFTQRENRFRFFSEDMLTRYASAESKISFYVIAMPEDPMIGIETDGFFNSTISTLNHLYVNSWLLRCVE